MIAMKNSGIEWIDQIPNNWTVNRIKNMFNAGKGLSITKADLIDQGLPVISYGQIHSKLNNGTDIKDSLLRFVDYSYKKYYPQCKVNNSDFVFADTSEDYDGIGNCVYKRDDSLLYAGYHAIVLKSKVPTDNRYLAYLFQTDAWRKQLRESASGVKVFSVSQRALLNASIILPTNDEMISIANYLDEKCAEIDALSADVQAEIETLEAYKQSVIAESVTKGLDKNVVMKDSGMAWIGKIPSHWLVEKVKYHLVRREPKNPGEKEVLSVYRDYGVIPKDSRDDNHNVTSEDTSKYKYVKPGNLVINKMKAWQGSMGISAYEGIVSPAYFIYHFTDDLILPTYLHYLFRTCYKDEFRRISGGIREGQWDLSPEAFGNTLLLIPSLQEQKEITEHINIKVKELDELIAQKQEQLTVLADYKKSLIYEYVTGKKEVPEI